jgi:hypothetical protein
MLSVVFSAGAGVKRLTKSISKRNNRLPCGRGKSRATLAVSDPGGLFLADAGVVKSVVWCFPRARCVAGGAERDRMTNDVFPAVGG